MASSQAGSFSPASRSRRTSSRTRTAADSSPAPTWAGYATHGQDAGQPMNTPEPGTHGEIPAARLDALLPPEMAERAEEIGVRKATLDLPRLFTLAVLAGAFIALGSVFATTALAGAGAAPWGPVRVLAGAVFSLGLILVVVGGAELFTGNNLIVMAWASGRVTTRALIRNWAMVYTGNFVGATATAALV